MPKDWYIYIGGNPNALFNYIRFDESPGVAAVAPPASCQGGFNLCAIFAPNCGINPTVISPNIRSYIARGLAVGTNQPDTPPGAQIHVVFKVDA